MNAKVYCGLVCVAANKTFSACFTRLPRRFAPRNDKHAHTIGVYLRAFAESINKPSAASAPQRLCIGLKTSMSEMSHPGKHHRHAVFIGGGDDFIITHRAAGLNHRLDAGFESRVDAIAEREEGVRGHH